MTARPRPIAAVLAVLCAFAGTSPTHAARRFGVRTARTGTVAASQPVGGGLSLGFPTELAADPSGALFVADRGAAFEEGVPAPVDPTILRVDPDGTRTIVADPWRGSGPRLSGPDLFVEPDGQLLFGLLRIDPATGDRTTVSNRRVGRFWTPQALALESATHALLGDEGVEINIPSGGLLLNIQAYSALRRVDLATGRSELVAGGGLLSGKRGRGPGFLCCGVPVLTLTTPNAVVTAVQFNGLLTTLPTSLSRIDLVTGDRTLVSGPDRGTGPGISTPQDIAVDESGIWWVVSSGQHAAYRVDPATGDRTRVSGRDRGRGPQLDRPRAVLLEPEGTLIVVSSGSSDDSVRFPFATVMRVDPVTGDRTVLSRY